MNFYSDQELKSNSKEKYSNQTNDESILTPRKRSRPSLSHHLDLTDQSKQSNSYETRFSSNNHFQQNHQKIIQLRQSQTSFEKSKFISNQQHSSKSILELLDDDEDENDDDDDDQDDEIDVEQENEININRMDNDQQVINLFNFYLKKKQRFFLFN